MLVDVPAQGDVLLELGDRTRVLPGAVVREAEELPHARRRRHLVAERPQDSQRITLTVGSECLRGAGELGREAGAALAAEAQELVLDGLRSTLSGSTRRFPVAWCWRAGDGTALALPGGSLADRAPRACGRG